MICLASGLAEFLTSIISVFVNMGPGECGFQQLTLHGIRQFRRYGTGYHTFFVHIRLPKEEETQKWRVYVWESSCHTYFLFFFSVKQEAPYTLRYKVYDNEHICTHEFQQSHRQKHWNFSKYTFLFFSFIDAACVALWTKKEQKDLEQPCLESWCFEKKKRNERWNEQHKQFVSFYLMWMRLV